VIATGTPEELAELRDGSYTGQYLQRVLNGRRSATPALT
jgi:excinuclease UvrABC ATPase subunit